MCRFMCKFGFMCPHGCLWVIRFIGPHGCLWVVMSDHEHQLHGCSLASWWVCVYIGDHNTTNIHEQWHQWLKWHLPGPSNNMWWVRELCSTIVESMKWNELQWLLKIHNLIINKALKSNMCSAREDKDSANVDTINREYFHPSHMATHGHPWKSGILHGCSWVLTGIHVLSPVLLKSQMKTAVVIMGRQGPSSWIAINRILMAVGNTFPVQSKLYLWRLFTTPSCLLCAAEQDTSGRLNVFVSLSPQPGLQPTTNAGLASLTKSWAMQDQPGCLRQKQQSALMLPL
jgi:hypothetical protein